MLTPEERNPIGTHVLAGKDLVRGAFQNARKVGAEAVQVFTGNPRGWALTEGDPQVDAAFRQACHNAGMRVFIHTPYLVNLGSPNPDSYRKSVALIEHNMRRATEIGAEGVVVHTGSCVTDGYFDAALQQVKDALLPVLDKYGADDDPRLLLEPTAGQGRSLCARVSSLPRYLDALENHPRAGLCIDTCHYFAAGECLDEPGGATEMIDQICSIAGQERLCLVHANDSKDTRGSLRDRHEKIGQGHIGTGAFDELLSHPALAGVPFILETPGSRDAGDESTLLLREIREKVSKRILR